VAVAKRLVLSGLTWELSPSEDLEDLEKILLSAMKDRRCVAVALANGQRLLVNGALTKYVMLWNDTRTHPAAPPVAEVASKVHN
jgi:hypothetical protein